MAVREIVDEDMPTPGWARPDREIRVWSGSGALREDRAILAYKWLRRGAIDPDEGYDWSAGRTWHGARTRSGCVHGVGHAGLPFGVNDELWLVELRDPVGITPCPEQRAHGGPRMFGVPERRVIAREGRLVRRVDAWTDRLAREFAAVCARRTRERVGDALVDAGRMLADDEPTVLGGSQLEHRTAVPERGDGPPGLRAVELLIGIWRDALAMDARGMEHPSSVYATAAAASRSAAALAYVPVTDAEARATADRAYADERRWQARWLADRLGLRQGAIAA